nr:salivary glue protein Sgs-3-like [Arachis hypogaea]
MNAQTSKMIIPWRLLMPTTIAQLKVITNKEATIIKGEILTKGGKTTPTKDGGTTIIKEEGTTVGTKHGGTTIIKEEGTTTTTTNKTGTNKTLHTKTKAKEEPTKPTKHLIKESTSTSTTQPPSSSALPSQSLPNPKGGINAITLRSGTKLQEMIHEEPSPIEVTQDEDMVEIEEVEEEDEAQEVVEEVIAQPRGVIPKDGNVL